jgi:hypothetical protein
MKALKPGDPIVLKDGRTATIISIAKDGKSYRVMAPTEESSMPGWYHVEELTFTFGEQPKAPELPKLSLEDEWAEAGRSVHASQRLRA